MISASVLSESIIAASASSIPAHALDPDSVLFLMDIYKRYRTEDNAEINVTDRFITLWISDIKDFSVKNIPDNCVLVETDSTMSYINNDYNEKIVEVSRNADPGPGKGYRVSLRNVLDVNGESLYLSYTDKRRNKIVLRYPDSHFWATYTAIATTSFEVDGTVTTFGGYVFRQSYDDKSFVWADRLSASAHANIPLCTQNIYINFVPGSDNKTIVFSYGSGTPKFQFAWIYFKPGRRISMMYRTVNCENPMFEEHRPFDNKSVPDYIEEIRHTLDEKFGIPDDNYCYDSQDWPKNVTFVCKFLNNKQHRIIGYRSNYAERFVRYSTRVFREFEDDEDIYTFGDGEIHLYPDY